MDFCHLHLHTEYSVLDGFGKAEQYIQLAKKLGFTALANTDHANIDGLIKFQKCCDTNEIKPVLGCELYVVDDLTIKEDTKEKKEKRGHIVALVKNAIGWNNLTKMLTIANLNGFYKKPRVDFKTILEHYEGLIFLTACTSSFVYNDKGIEFLEELLKKTRDIYCEIMPINFQEQAKHNKYVLDIAKKYSLGIVATNDCHYPTSESSMTQEVLLAIQTKVKWDDPKRWKFDSTDLYLKSAKEMYKSFLKHHQYIDDGIISEAMENTIKIANQCNFKLKKEKIFLPSVIENIDEFEYLQKLCTDGLKEKAATKNLNVIKYRKQIELELKIIKQQGFISYFLIIQDIIAWCKKNNIMVGYNRGSVGGSLVAYLIGITEVDPIRHELMFERFISPDRVDLPDIDIDFEDKKRGEVREYIESKYGNDNVASVSTFLQMKSKMVFRDVCRVFDIPMPIVNQVAPFIEMQKDIDYSSSEKVDTITSDFEKIFNTSPECIEFKSKYPKIVNYCCQLEGQVRGLGKHAAALILTKDSLKNSDRCNLTLRNDAVTVNWDKKDAEYMGMLKIDILGLSNLSIMHYAKDLIKQNHNIDIDFNKIDLSDKNILNEFAEGNCIGIFQFGTYGLRKLCKDLKINSFELLTHATAMYRPMSLRSGMVDEFKQRHIYKKNFKYGNKLDSILNNTHGIVFYQEQVLQIIHELAGLPFTIADRIRKLLDSDNKEALDEYKYDFIFGCKKNGIDRHQATQIWEMLVSQGGYGFNKSHAVGYTMLSFANMYIKYYYPTEFICANLTFADKEKKQELLNEALRLKIEIMSPKIGFSDPIYWIPKNKKIYMPFIEIFGVGEKYAAEIGKIKLNSNGFFTEEQKQKPKIVALLNELDAYNENSVIRNAKLIPYFY